MTATQAADLFRESPASCSFHLRQLAKYGLARPGLRPPGARRVTYLHLAFPGDLSGAREREESPEPGTPEPDR